MRRLVRSASRMRSPRAVSVKWLLAQRCQTLLDGIGEQPGVGGKGEPLEALVETRRDVLAVCGRARGDAAGHARGEGPINEFLSRGAVAQCLRQIALADEH